MVTKITIGFLILVLIVGGFWLFYYQQGANRPITIEGTATIMMSTMRSPYTLDIVYVATPRKHKLSVSTATKEKYDLILKLNKKIFQMIDHKEGAYAEVEFKYVEKDKVEEPKKFNADQYDMLEETVDAQYIGTGQNRYFCRKIQIKNIPGTFEIWLTRDTKMGRAYIGTLNRLLRIEVVNAPMPAAALNAKRPQLSSKDIRYFPIPFKADISVPVPGLGNYRLQWEAKKVSRGRVKTSAFELPSGYKKVSFEQMGQLMQQKIQGSFPTPQSRTRIDRRRSPN